MKKILFVICLCCSTAALAQWTKLGENQEAIVRIDNSLIKRNSDSIEAWVMLDLKKPRQLFAGDRDINSAVILYEYDCTENKARILEKNIFSERNGEGDKFLSTNKPEYWLSISPTTLNYKVFKYLCRPS